MNLFIFSRCCFFPSESLNAVSVSSDIFFWLINEHWEENLFYVFDICGYIWIDMGANLINYVLPVASHNDILWNDVLGTCHKKLTTHRKYVCYLHSHRHIYFQIYIYVYIYIYIIYYIYYWNI